MKLAMEISRAVNHINAQVNAKDVMQKKNENEINEIIEKAKKDFTQHQFDFANSKTITLTQDGKKRFAKRFEDIYSTENILCQCIKYILDREYKVKYPNRNKISKSLFNTIGSIKNMSEFTIIKFDFKDYFNTVSSVYVYEKFLKLKLSNRFEMDLVEEYSKKTMYAYAGLQTSNSIAEIIAKAFDVEILKEFSLYGLLYYERYIDDGIIILNENLSEEVSKKIIDNAIEKIFFDDNIPVKPRCKTKMNIEKFQYISKQVMKPREKYNVDFLGYEFNLYYNDNKLEIQYGITEVKMKKYAKRIDKIIKLYSEKMIAGSKNHDYQQLELLRQRLAAFTSREVYVTNKFKSNIWKVKGFNSNYGELRYLLDTTLVNEKTKIFLKESVKKAFNDLGVTLPYFMLGESEAAYSLYQNMKKNRTLLFEPHIGYDISSLRALCKKVGITVIDSSGKYRSYRTLVRDYLIKMKVGY